MAQRWTPRPPATPEMLALQQDRHDCPADFAGSIGNQAATDTLSGASTTATQISILTEGAQAGQIDLHNPFLQRDIAMRIGDEKKAGELATIARYNTLGQGVLGGTERFLRRIFSPVTRRAINDGIIER